MTRIRHLFGLLILVALAAWWSMPALTQDSEEAQKSGLIRFVEERLSTPNRQISLNGIQGTLSSDVRFASITISDENGIWLTIVNPRLQWTRTALLAGMLDIRSLTADRIDWPRMPVADQSMPAPESSGFSLPDLPVSVDIEELAIQEAQFGAPVFGLASTLSLNGQLSLNDAALDANLDIRRLDGPGGQLALQTSYSDQSGQLDIDLSLQEPKNGVVANLLNIPERPPVALTIAGSGPLSEFAAQIAFDADGERVADGSVNVTEDASGARLLGFDLSGPIARILPEEHRAFFGDATALTAQALLRADGGLDIRELQLDSGALDITASGSTLADGFLRDLTVDATLRSADAGPVRLPLGGEPVTVDNGKVSLRYGTNDADSWTLSGTINGIALPDAKIVELTIDGGGAIAGLNTPGNRSVTFTVQGDASGIRPQDPGVAKAVGDTISFSTDGDWKTGGPISIANAQVSGDTLDIDAQGVVEDMVFKGGAKVQAADLQAFSLVADRDLAGKASLAVNGDAGLVGGSFDLTFDGSLTDARIGTDSVDRLLAGETRLTGGAARTADGLTFRDLALSNPQAEASINGAFASRRADLQIKATIAEMARIVDNASGRLTLDAAVNKPEGSSREASYDVRAQLGLANARLASRAVPSADLAFDGRVAGTDIIGTISGDGSIGGEALTVKASLARGANRVSLSDLLLRVGSAQLSGDLSTENGRVDGQVAIAANDIAPLAALALVDASGAVNGTAKVSGSTSDPQVAFNVRGTAIDAPQLRAASVSPITLSASGSYGGGAVRVSQFNAENAQDLKFSGSGTIPLSGPGLSVAVNGGAPLALAERYLAARGTRLSGTLRIDATIGGSLSSPSADGLFSISNATVNDPLSNLRLNQIGVVAGLRGDTLAINRMTGQLAGGGSVSVSGTIGLSGQLPANLSIRLSNATYSDRQTIRTTLSGDLAVSGGLTAGPLISGRIDLLGTEITVPETLTGDADLLDVRHVDPDSGTLKTLQRIQAVLPKDGGSGPQAPVRLDVTLNSPNRIFVRGRGIDAEMGGQLRVTGSLDNLQPIGGFTLIRGRLTILNKRLDLTEGRITMTGSLDPMIDLSAQVTGDDVVATLRLYGRASDLSLTLSSSPELPQDQILARVLFGKSLSSLSPLQIANLATAAASLASGGSGGGLSEQLRQGIGVDDLDITQDQQGNVGVRAGKYIQDNVYLDIQAGQGGGEASINLDITDSLTAKGTVDTEGDSKLGIFFEKDY